MATPQVPVLIPLITVSALNKTHAGFNEPASKKALATKVIGWLFVYTVKLIGIIRFLTDVHDSGSSYLHLVGQFECLNAGIKSGI